jgi:hypothetical protein
VSSTTVSTDANDGEDYWLSLLQQTNDTGAGQGDALSSPKESAAAATEEAVSLSTATNRTEPLNRTEQKPDELDADAAYWESILQDGPE